MRSIELRDIYPLFGVFYISLKLRYANICFMQVERGSRTILLTGATGFLGSAILRSLVDSGEYRIIILKRSFSDLFRIEDMMDKVIAYDIDIVSPERVFEEFPIDIVLHCATDYGRKSVSPMQIIEANLTLPLKLLECAVEHGVGSFINTDTILDKRISHYSLSKKQFREWLEGFGNKMVIANVELSHFYGPGDDKTKFVSNMLDLLIRGVPSIPLTRGEQIRDFIYIDDVVDAFNRIIKHVFSLENGFYEFQVCEGARVSVRDLVLALKRELGNSSTELNFGSLPYREHEAMKPTGNAAALFALGWQPKYSLDQGLKILAEMELGATGKNN